MEWNLYVDTVSLKPMTLTIAFGLCCICNWAIFRCKYKLIQTNIAAMQCDYGGEWEIDQLNENLPVRERVK